MAIEAAPPSRALALIRAACDWDLLVRNQRGPRALAKIITKDTLCKMLILQHLSGVTPLAFRAFYESTQDAREFVGLTPDQLQIAARLIKLCYRFPIGSRLLHDFYGQIRRNGVFIVPGTLIPPIVFTGASEPRKQRDTQIDFRKLLPTTAEETRPGSASLARLESSSLRQVFKLPLPLFQVAWPVRRGVVKILRKIERSVRY